MSDKFLMKGHVWSERKHLVKYPVFAEVKYDEIRCHVKLSGNSVEFLSYDGNSLSNLSSWAGQFHNYMVSAHLHHLDIGILVNKNFNDSYRWTRSSSGYPVEKLNKKTGKVAPALHPEMVEFYLFDIPECDAVYFDRSLQCRSHADLMSLKGIPMSAPTRLFCKDESDVDSAFMDFRSMGYEGAMIKSLDHTYRIGKRTDGWLKMKPESEADGKVIGFVEAVSESGAPLGRVGSILVEMEDGSRAAPYGFDHDLARLIWSNQADYIGEWVMFKYMERDRAGGYRHPVFMRFREGK
jgi:hypothetical protein